MKILGLNGAAAKTGTVAALLSESLRAAAEEIAELGETPNTALIHLVVPHPAGRDREGRSGFGVEFSRLLRDMLVLAGTRSAFPWCYEPV